MRETVEKYTYCRICEPGCGIKAKVSDGKIESIAGDEKHPFSKGYLCARGRATLALHQDPDRLLYPMRKNGVGWERTSWGESVKRIGSEIRRIREQHGPHSIGVYFGNPVAFDFGMGLYLPLAMAGMKTRNFFSSGSQDCNNKFMAAKKMFGSPVLHPVPDFKNIEMLLILGSNPAVSQMSFLSLARPIERLREITARGGRVIFIDPRRTESAKMVGEHVFIRPDSDVYLLLAMLHVIISGGLYDRDTVETHTRGFDELKKLAAEYPPERASKITGIPAEKIKTLAEDFARAKNAGIHMSLGVNLGSFGTVGYWLTQALNAITGRFDRRGSLLFGEGLLNYGKVYKNRPGKITTGRESRIGGYPPVLGTAPAGVMADEILTPGKDQVRALIVISGNPMLTVPDPEKLGRALSSLELLVSIDLYRNETGEYAHYLLPGTDFYERSDASITGLGFNPERYLNWAGPVVAPAGERMDSAAAFHRVISAAGYPLLGSAVLGGVTRVIDGIGYTLGRTAPLSFQPDLLFRGLLWKGGISWKRMKESRQGLHLGDHKTGALYSELILHDDKKIGLAPAEFIAQAPALKSFFEENVASPGFKLIGRRTKRTHNSWMHNLPELVEKEKGNSVSIHPEDAARLEVESGDLVEVSSASGSITLPAEVTDEVMPGVVAVPHGWGHQAPSGLSVARKFPGMNVNLLMPSGPDTLERLAGMCKLTGIRVTVAKVDEKE